jgi:hypothetical protein
MKNHSPDSFRNSARTLLHASCIAAALLAFAATSIPARIWYITPDGTGDAATIQAGIDSAAVGDTVLVETGSYLDNLDFRGKEILVGSRFVLTGDTTLVAQTVIKALVGRVVSFTHGEGRAARLSGLTITGGSAPSGGGIRCFNASPTLDHLRVIGNTASFEGGGIHAQGGSPFVSACRVSENDSGYAGGGIACYSSAIVIHDNLIDGNHAQDFGGGISTDYSSPVITNNRIIGNDSFYAGCGIGSRDCTGIITDNYIADNIGADYGAGLFY